MIRAVIRFLLAGCSVLAAALLLTGCELTGDFSGENVKVHFGNTNDTAQAPP